MSLARLAPRIAVLIGLTMLILAPVAVSADGPVISEDGFWARLARTAQIMESAFSDEKAAIKRYEASRQIREIWQGASEVSLDSGGSYPLRLPFQLADWFEDSTRVQAEQMLTNVRSLLAFHDQIAGRSSTIDIPKAESALRDLARDPRFQYQESTTSPRVGVPSGLWNLTNNVVFILGLIVIAIVVASYFLRARWSLAWKRAWAKPNVPPEADHADDPATVREAEDRVLESERRGDLRSAVRYRYLACLFRLDERRLIYFDPALTNREYLLKFRENPDLANAFRPVVRTFDRVWYGYLPIGDSAYQQYCEAIQQMDRVSMP